MGIRGPLGVSWMEINRIMRIARVNNFHFIPNKNIPPHLSNSLLTCCASETNDYLLFIPETSPEVGEVMEF